MQFRVFSFANAQFKRTIADFSRNKKSLNKSALLQLLARAGKLGNEALKYPSDFATLNEVMTKTYDFIIAGGGMAGLSLAYKLSRSSLKNRSILIIDREKKTRNDHTWCFWERGTGDFEEVVSHQWSGFWFHGTHGFSAFLDLQDYRYKMISAIDFYRFVQRELSTNPGIEFCNAEIKEIGDGFAETSIGRFEAAEHLFDSATQHKYNDPKRENLLQHFSGWVIESESAVFDPQQPTLFDFRVEQKNECRFAYVLPFTPFKALVEFTVFSDNLLDQEEYERYLRTYVENGIGTKNYTISETEAGVIPMSDEIHDEYPFQKTIRIGTSGGYVKASTGYSFRRTQERLQKLVDKLERGETPKAQRSLRDRWKMMLDSVLLNVLRQKRHPADDVFTHLFQRNEAKQVLKFLDEETTLPEDFAIMRSVPMKPFILATAEVVKK